MNRFDDDVPDDNDAVGKSSDCYSPYWSMRRHHRWIIRRCCDAFRCPMGNDDSEDDGGGDGGDDDANEIRDCRTFDSRREIVEETLTNTIYSPMSTDEVTEHSARTCVSPRRNTTI